VSQDDRVLEPLAQLDRDRRGGAASAVHERLGLLAHELLQLVDLELDVRTRGCKHAPDGAGDRSDPRPAFRQLAACGDEALQQRFARLGRLLRDLRQRLDGPPGHPATAVLTVAPQLFDPLPEDRGHGSIVRRRRMPS
jgi:hypothetical protein